MDINSIATKLEDLQDLMIDVATGGSGDKDKYRTLRNELRSNLTVKALLPVFVEECHAQDRFWRFIQQRYSRYHERRTFIYEAFKATQDKLEALSSPGDDDIERALASLDPDHVRGVWLRALHRRSSDPEGALTSARTLIETVCKYILADLSVAYSDKEELPRLYKLVAENLNLAPSQHTEPAFKQILGSCTSVVETLATLRNKVGDAHGQGPKPIRPAPHHAELAVNLAGTMATFLVATWRKRKGNSTT